MNMFRRAEKVLGITSNQLTLKNTLNDAALYECIKQFRENYDLNKIDEEWSKVSSFISLLYAKALNINEEQFPELFWNQRNGLLKNGQQFQLASAINLIVEGNNLSLLEYKHFKRISHDSLSTKLYFKSLDIIKRLNNERIYLDLKQSIDSFHKGLNKWNKFEENWLKNFFNQNENYKEKLTFDNYSDFVLLQEKFIQPMINWEELIQCNYGNLLGYACSSMALLANHNYNTWKVSFDFGFNFAFNYIINQQFKSYFNPNESDNETICLHLPLLLHLKLTKDEKKRKALIETMLSKRYCSFINFKLKLEVKNSNKTLNQIKTYSQSYQNQAKNCLNKLKKSNSRDELLQITKNLFENFDFN